ITFTITSDTEDNSFCITGSGSGYITKNINQDNQYSDGPCEGVSGGEAYCPNNSHVVINGYYCEGVLGSVASHQVGARKILASDPEVPTGAPAHYVGKQEGRDNLGSNTFTASAGDVFCVSGWA